MLSLSGRYAECGAATVAQILYCACVCAQLYQGDLINRLSRASCSRGLHPELNPFFRYRTENMSYLCAGAYGCVNWEPMCMVVSLCPDHLIRQQEYPMHINFHTYRTIKRSLAQVLHTRASSHAEQHLNTLSLLICGMLGAQHSQLDKLASHAPIRGRKN